MAKGKTNQPLVIDVAEVYAKHPAIEALRVAGHVVRVMEVPPGGTAASLEPDWICHPAAGWHEVFFEKNERGEYPFVQARLKAERARKRGRA